ncbi:MAG: lysylphosphatidylglycerol synthase transmembrane domain-containing protein [Hylemonella sp.]|nr:lysylphosphatidylglycerol synthase transmembrane domain-containing protein [Hylemonella sp.]
MIKRAVRLSVSVALLAWAISLLNLEIVIDTIRGSGVISFSAAIIINLLTFVTTGTRWFWMVSRQEQSTPYLPHLAVYFRATFLNAFTPANLGGDVYRVIALKSNTLLAGDLLRLLIRERLLGLYSCLAVFAISWLWLPQRDLDFSNPFLWSFLLATAAFIVPVIAGTLSGQMKSWMRRMLGPSRLPQMESWVDVGTELFTAPGTGRLFLISVLSMLMWILSIKVVTEGVGLSVSYVQLAAVATLVEIARLLPLTIQGIGLREGVFAYLLATLGHDPDRAFAAGAVAYIGLSIAIVLAAPAGSLIELLSTKLKQKRIDI